MYEAFYGLRDKPFRLNPDPAFFFGSAGHRRALAYLDYGMHQGEGFIVVTGDVGAGKTLLLQTLFEKVDPGRIVPVQIVSTQVEADDLLRLVASGFNVPNVGVDKATLLHSLHQHFLALRAEGKRALLVVDEAQNLSQHAVEELRMLSNFQVGKVSLLQSFLVGQPEFRRIIESPQMRQLRQRVIAMYHLGPLAAAEVRQYIEHRLNHVGWSGRPQIDDAAFAAVYQHTDGIPRRINTLMDRALLAGYLDGKLQITVADIDEISAEMGAETVNLNHTSGDMTDDSLSAGGAMSGLSSQAAISNHTIEESLARIREQVEAINASTALFYREWKQQIAGVNSSDQGPASHHRA
jgi:general secretion pathway protein A